MEHRSESQQIRIAAFYSEMQKYYALCTADAENKWVMVHFLHWTDVHKEYKRWYKFTFSNETEQPVSYSWFYIISRSQHQEFVLASRSKLPRCSLCTLLGDIILESKKDKSRKQYLSELRRKHLELQVYFDCRRTKAIENPEEYISIILDRSPGVRLPQYHTYQVKDNNQQMFNFIGLINHGAERRELYLLPENEFPFHDANVTITILHTHLMRALKSAAMKKQIPKVLFIQLDSTSSENKNHFLLGYCEWLVRNTFFDEVFLSFLIPGTDSCFCL